MIQRDSGEMQLVCDECGGEHPDTFANSDFQEMINSARAGGWTVKPDGEGGWKHICCEEIDRVAKAKTLFGIK